MTEFAVSSGAAGSFRDAVKALRRYIVRKSIRSALLGVSGGADSVLALRLLAEASKEIPGFSLAAAHANFQLRGDESTRDEEFVRDLAKEMPDVRFFFERFDTDAYAREKRISIEMAARELRHSWWDELKDKHGFQVIATGHNADDNEETLLLNLLRGSSPRGLRGMDPLGDRIFRPLLGLHRKEILRLLEEEASGARFMTDSTNLQSDYRRNFLRNEVLPLLRDRWEGLDSTLQTVLELQSETSALTDRTVADFLDRHGVSATNELPFDVLSTFPAPLTLVYSWLSSYGLNTHKAREILSHLPSSDRPDMTPGRRWNLDDGSQVVTTPRSFRLEVYQPSATLGVTYSEIPDCGDWQVIAIADDRASIMAKVKGATQDEIYLPHPPSEYDWRPMKEGDRISLFPDRSGRRKTKLVSDVLREAGIPMATRRRILLLVNKATHETVWIPGIRRGGSDLIDGNCNKIFYLNLHK